MMMYFDENRALENVHLVLLMFSGSEPLHSTDCFHSFYLEFAIQNHAPF